MTTPRRWSFSLRMMFVGVTVVALAVGYVVRERGVVRQRAQMLQWVMDSEPDPLDGGCPFAYAADSTGSTWLRRAFGDVHVKNLLLPRCTNGRTHQQFIDMFPEANINQWPLREDWTANQIDDDDCDLLGIPAEGVIPQRPRAEEIAEPEAPPAIQADQP